jgi:hypothetical protein
MNAYMKKYLQPHIKWYLEELARMGKDDHPLAPEIEGANKTVKESSSARSVLRALGDSKKASIDVKTGRLLKIAVDAEASNQPSSMADTEVTEALSFLFSDCAQTGWACADLEIEPGKVAALSLSYTNEIPVELTVERQVPHYPHHMVSKVQSEPEGP